MRAWAERVAYLAAIAVLCGLLLSAGRTQAALRSELPVAASELLAALAAPGHLIQVVDVRPTAHDYLDSHIPTALPLPDCDPMQATPAAQRALNRHLPTFLITADGDVETFRRCAQGFASARNLTGGFSAWIDAGYPEEDGEYVPPKSSPSGGCL